MAEHLASQDVDYLEGSGAGDDEFAVADKGKVVRIGLVKDKKEPAGVIAVAGIERITWILKQVDIVASQMVDEVEVINS